MKTAFASILFAGAAAAAFATARAEEPIAVKAITVNTYLNGGIGNDEQQAMRRMARDFPLRIEFSEHDDNEFIADVPVAITDGEGNPVFQLAEAGPMLFVSLPDGKYRVTATRNGKTEMRSVDLNGGRGRELYFHWQ
jgi:hypothetical protein